MRPLKDNIIVKPIIDSEKTSSGIFLAKTIDSEAKRDTYPNKGTVISSLDDNFVEGEVIIFSRFGSSIITDNNIDYYIVPVSDVLAKIENN